MLIIIDPPFYRRYKKIVTNFFIIGIRPYVIKSNHCAYRCNYHLHSLTRKISSVVTRDIEDQMC